MEMFNLLFLFLNKLKVFKASILGSLWHPSGLAVSADANLRSLLCLSLNGPEGEGSTRGRNARGVVLWRLGRTCGKGDFHTEVGSLGESLVLSRSSEQAGTTEKYGYSLGVVRGHSRAPAGAPWVSQPLGPQLKSPES